MEAMVPMIQESVELRTFRDPKQVLGEAALVGNAVDALVRRKPALVTVIAGRRHPRFELLQIVATMFRVTARARETRHIDYDGVEGWECDAEAFHIPSGQVVSTAQAMCLNDEPNWDMRPTKNGVEKVPTFQRRSMAQTRACSKALRLAIGWVLGMAGYEATAAEEMTGNETASPDQAGNGLQTPQRKAPAPGNGGWCPSEAQVKRIYALGHTANRNRDEVEMVIAAHGVGSAAEIPSREVYEVICADVMKPKGAGQQ